MYSIDTVTNIKNLKPISNVHILTCCIANIPTKITCKCITVTPCILKVEINEMLSIQTPHLIILPTVHLKDAIELMTNLYTFITPCNVNS